MTVEGSKATAESSMKNMYFSQGTSDLFFYILTDAVMIKAFTRQETF